jgi:peptidylprolyl isomerase
VYFLVVIIGNEGDKMKTIQEGDAVQILCKAELETGELCFETEKDKPIEIVIGQGKFFPAIEQALLKMKEGEQKTVTLEPKDAFGPHLNDLVITIPRNAVNANEQPTIGSRVKIEAPTGKTYIALITKVNDDSLTLDLNHPLAGKNVVFTFTVFSIINT